MQRQGMHRPRELIGQHLVNRLMPLYLHLPGKIRRHQRHLEMGFRIRRHRMHMALVLHRQQLCGKPVFELGFNCVLNFHKKSSAPTSQMTTRNIAAVCRAPESAFYRANCTESQAVVVEAFAKVCVARDGNTKPPWTGSRRLLGKLPPQPPPPTQPVYYTTNDKPEALDTKAPNRHIPMPLSEPPTPCTCTSPKNPAWPEPSPPPSPARTRKARAGYDAAKARKRPPSAGALAICWSRPSPRATTRRGKSGARKTCPCSPNNGSSPPKTA